MTQVDQTRFLSLYTRASESGTLISNGITNVWVLSRKCENPVLRTVSSVFLYDTIKSAHSKHGMHPLAESGFFKYPFHGERTVYMDIEVSCRKCRPCIKLKSYLWSERMKRELLNAPRTWWCTFTYNPRYRAELLFRSSPEAGRETTARLTDLVKQDMTKMLKRLRKAGLKIRYFAVMEHHKDGFPHLHMLLHEQVRGEVTHRILTNHWPFGFVKCKLVNLTLPDSASKVSRYVAKYMTKTADARVRASLKYGQIPHAPDRCGILEGA